MTRSGLVVAALAIVLLLGCAADSDASPEATTSVPPTTYDYPWRACDGPTPELASCLRDALDDADKRLVLAQQDRREATLEAIDEGREVGASAVGYWEESLDPLDRSVDEYIAAREDLCLAAHATTAPGTALGSLQMTCELVLTETAITELSTP